MERREFIRGSIAGAAATLFDTPAQGADKVKVNGALYLEGAMDDDLYPYDMQIDGEHFLQTERDFEADVTAGSHDISLTGTSLKMKRTLGGVYIPRDTTLDIFALSRDFPDELIDQYRQMCMGIDIPNPGGGTAINPGSSVRLAQTPRVIIVKSLGISDNYYDVVKNGSRVLDRFSGLDKAQVEFAEYGTKPRMTPGNIFVNFDGRGTYSWASQYILDAAGWMRGGMVHLLHESDVAANWGLYRNWLFVRMLVEHEFGHQMGLDHTTADSLMSPYGRGEGPTIDDYKLCGLKYLRQPFHVLTKEADTDAYQLRAPPNSTDPIYSASQKTIRCGFLDI